MRKTWRVWLIFCSLCLGLPGLTQAQEVGSRVVTVQSSRSTSDGGKVSIEVVEESAVDAPKAVLLMIPTSRKANGAPLLPHNRHEPVYMPLSRNRDPLLQAGLALVWMGWPSEAQFGRDGKSSYEMHDDIGSAIQQVRQRWPGVPLILSGTYTGGQTALTYALKHRDRIDGLLALSPLWGSEREQKVEALKGLKALVLHDTSGECLVASTIEVEEIAGRAGFARVPVFHDRLGQVGRCSNPSAVWLPRADSRLAETVVAWLAGQALPDHLGAAEPVITTTERVLFVQGKSGRMEVTLFTPPGRGPFPLLVFNHGDVTIDHSSIRLKARLRETVVGEEFLRQGFAVAVPQRPGVGRSAGIYRSDQFQRNDGDATYKGRIHNEAIMDALDKLRGIDGLRMDQVLLSGQSAGGYAVTYAGTLGIPGVRGIVNFSGGRSNTSESEAPVEENTMMIRGFSELGAQARVPAMLIFAENDSRYSANTIRKSAQAYRDAGGQAQLLLLPPQPGDGHHVYHRPELWRSELVRFVSGLNMGNSPTGAAVHPAPAGTVPATAQTHPELFDIGRVPVHSDGCRKFYTTFLEKSAPRYFAVGAEGKGCAYSAGERGSAEKAIEMCQKHAVRCVLYAVDNEVVASTLVGSE